MNRRNALKTGLLATGGAFIPASLQSFSPVIPNPKKQYPSLKMKIGELETYILSDGIVSLNEIQPVFAPNIDPTLVLNQMEKLHLDGKGIEAAINILLIKKDTKLILLDTGCGPLFGDNGGNLVDVLASIGVNRQDITDIVITHAHIDHIGGILDKEDNLIFQNAAYHIAEREYDFWMAENPDFSKSKGTNDNDFSIAFAKKVLMAIKNRLHRFQYGERLFDCLIPELGEGHTYGHTMFTIYSGDQSLKHIVDAFHSPLFVAQPQWGTQWDVDFDKAIQTRQQIIKEGITNKTLLMSCHLPWPGLGYIDKINDEVYWTAYPYFNPLGITIK